MINRIVLVGRLTRDPELKNTNSGNPICSFTLAVDNRARGADGERTTSYIPCVVFSQQADTVSKYVRKGSLVGVEGRLSTRTFERKDGTKGSAFEVICDSVQFLEPKTKRENTEVYEEETPTNTVTAESNLDSLEIVDDELPF